MYYGERESVGKRGALFQILGTAPCFVCHLHGNVFYSEQFGNQFYKFTANLKPFLQNLCLNLGGLEWKGLGGGELSEGPMPREMFN